MNHWMFAYFAAAVAFNSLMVAWLVVTQPCACPGRELADER